MKISELQYVVDRYIPLTRTEDDGSIVDVLGWMIEGRLHVHPDRLEMLKSAIDNMVDS